jgi:hypothetical protein
MELCTILTAAEDSNSGVLVGWRHGQGGWDRVLKFVVC